MSEQWLEGRKSLEEDSVVERRVGNLGSTWRIDSLIFFFLCCANRAGVTLGQTGQRVSKEWWDSAQRSLTSISGFGLDKPKQIFVFGSVGVQTEYSARKPKRDDLKRGPYGAPILRVSVVITRHGRELYQ